MANQEMIKEMHQAGVHVGRQKSSTDPKMKPFIFGLKNNLQIIDLEKSAEKLSAALDLLRKVAQNGGKIIFVGTKPAARKTVEEAAKRCDQPHVTLRWLGGTLTNFSTISKRINYLKDLERKKETGELKKYTKKEQLTLERKLAELTEQLGGLKSLDKLPAAIFVADVKENEIVVKEAKIKKIPVVGLINTNADPTTIEYPIPANTNAASSIKYLVNKIAEAILSSAAAAEEPEATAAGKKA